jgi:hypothetical protein
MSFQLDSLNFEPLISERLFIQLLEQFTTPVFNGRTAGSSEFLQNCCNSPLQIFIVHRKICQSLQCKSYDNFAFIIALVPKRIGSRFRVLPFFALRASTKKV